MIFKFYLLENNAITVKRKPVVISNSNNNAKKNKKTSLSPSKATNVSVSFDIEATICPICDEACTCPKTTTPSTATTTNVAINSVKKKPSSELVKKPVSKTPPSKSKKNSKTNNIKSKPKNNNKKKIIYSEDDLVEDDGEYEGSFDEESENDEREEIVEDPALSFIRMIYSDEESLDEEEAYALYQATQLFSSSEDDDEDREMFYSDYEGSEGESSVGSSESSEFEYTVVEYVQPLKRKRPTEFVAYESGNESESEQVGPESTSLLLNANGTQDDDDDEDDADSVNSSQESIDSQDSTENDENNNWLTYSVFDVDRDLILQGNQQGQQQCVTSLSSHGSGGTPETLLFSTSSTDKIPNIAPQVLAAISAAAKHMANNQHNGNGVNNHSRSSKYFSYITLKDPLRGAGEEVNEEEFLFFEDPNEEDSDLELEEDSEVEEEEFVSDNESLEESEEVEGEEVCVVSDDFVNNQRKPSTSTRPPTTIANSTFSTCTTSSSTLSFMNRWNRVPIGAFRRSRRPSIPNFYHQFNPSAALKTFSDPSAALTLTTTTATSSNNGDDSFDEAATTRDSSLFTGAEINRAYSVISWDELDMDILPINSNNNNNNTNNSSPIPKRSRSVVAQPPPFTNNYEWLNNNWNNWEM